MGFWMSTLSSCIGSFVGLVGAIFIAIWQVKKAQKLNNIPFYLDFNKAQIYINRYIEKVEEILSKTQGIERKNARKLLSQNDYVYLKENLELAIKTVNKEIKQVDFKNFSEVVLEINLNAPLTYYKDLNFLFFTMAVMYNFVINDSKNIVRNLPPKIGLYFANDLPILFILRKFKQRYKKLKKQMKI
ncbi:hypothetical protein [Fictibacillus sp. S7]|uniref:hypothetical protein n=1 Tax=Fictibacillus sp. S7 TaxID=2212476 RepID=UPI00101278CF|nr:hypothetical protein [Fictibacillus sp. S7]RXY98546.1 hypothetical protein DMO16_02060 [Fictibacillus sp. S7]